MCIGAILWSRIEKVYYCASSEDAAKIGFDDDSFYKIIRDKKRLDQMFILDETEKSASIDLFKHYSESTHQAY
jgi:guanine deaminase